VFYGLAAWSRERLVVGDFSSADLRGWGAQSFGGETDYAFVTIDGHTALRARCNASASGLVIQHTIDLSQPPVLHWSWRIDDV
jgi:hypothetical protein